MLNEEEQRFVKYWEENRMRKKKVFLALGMGLPLGVILVAAIFLNFFSGWFKLADMTLNSEQPSLIWVLLIAALLIVAFIATFSARHKWDLNEQYYRELLARKENEDLIQQ